MKGHTWHVSWKSWTRKRLGPTSHHKQSCIFLCHLSEHLTYKPVQPSARVSQGRFCFWKWERHALLLQRLLYSCHSCWTEGANLHQALQIFWIVFVLSTAGGFCSQSGCQSWSISGLYLPLVWLWWTHKQGVQFCLQVFQVRRNMFPNHPGNRASSQAE